MTNPTEYVLKPFLSERLESWWKLSTKFHCNPVSGSCNFVIIQSVSRSVLALLVYHRDYKLVYKKQLEYSFKIVKNVFLTKMIC